MEKQPAPEQPSASNQTSGSSGVGDPAVVSYAKPVQRKANTTGLSDGLKTKMEGTFGTSLDHIQLKTNSSFPGKVGAIATAQGPRIDIAPGHYNPNTSTGQKLIGHEAWHTVQQAQGRVKPTVQMKTGHAVNDDKGLEAEADAMGEAVARAVNSPAIQAKSQALGVQPVQKAVTGPVQRYIASDTNVQAIADCTYDFLWENKPEEWDMGMFLRNLNWVRHRMVEDFADEQFEDKSINITSLMEAYMVVAFQLRPPTQAALPSGLAKRAQVAAVTTDPRDRALGRDMVMRWPTAEQPGSVMLSQHLVEVQAYSASSKKKFRCTIPYSVAGLDVRARLAAVLRCHVRELTVVPRADNFDEVIAPDKSTGFVRATVRPNNRSKEQMAHRLVADFMTSIGVRPPARFMPVEFIEDQQQWMETAAVMDPRGAGVMHEIVEGFTPTARDQRAGRNSIVMNATMFDRGDQPGIEHHTTGAVVHELFHSVSHPNANTSSGPLHHDTVEALTEYVTRLALGVNLRTSPMFGSTVYETNVRDLYSGVRARAYSREMILDAHFRGDMDAIRAIHQYMFAIRRQRESARHRAAAKDRASGSAKDT